MTKNFDVVVIGGGIIGCSIAFHLKKLNSNLKVLLLEKEDAVARHQTGRNSGVIHSGVYYKPGSLKAKFCRQGYQQLLEFAEENKIPFQITGKIIAATNAEQVKRLEQLAVRAQANGLSNSRLLSKEEMKEKEPHLSALSGLWVNETGIIDYNIVCQKYVELFQASGGEVLLNAKALNVREKSDGVFIESTQGEFFAKMLVTANGLFADQWAKDKKKSEYRIIPFRGEYYKLKASAQHLVQGLIYPVADPTLPFLGVHLTKRIDGMIEAGPNAVLALSREGYSWSQLNFKEFGQTVTWPGFLKFAAQHFKTGCYETYRSLSKEVFVRDLQKLVPSLTADDLEVAPSGVRAQAFDRNGLVDDFAIRTRGRIWNLINAPSPAATSSVAIGNEMAKSVLAMPMH